MENKNKKEKGRKEGDLDVVSSESIIQMDTEEEEALLESDASEPNALDKPVSKQPSTSASGAIRKNRPVPVVDVEERKRLFVSCDQLGPEGLTFVQAYQKKKRAVKTMERFLNMEEDLNEQQVDIMRKARSVLDDITLNEFIDNQMTVRQKLGIAPISSEEHKKNKESKEARKIDNEKRVAASKRKLSDSLVSSEAKKKITSPDIAKASTSRAAAASKVDHSLRLVLVDTSNDEGTIAD